MTGPYDGEPMLTALAEIDQLGQEHWDRAARPLAGTGSGHLNKAVGLLEASNILRGLLGLPRHPGYRNPNQPPGQRHV